MKSEIALTLALWACGAPEPHDTGAEPSEPGCDAPPLRMQIAHLDSGFGEPADGGAIGYGWPPQGGAPYAPFDVRFSGLGTHEALVEMRAVGVDDGVELGSAEYLQRFICANTGESEGWYVTSELHMRFFGFTLEELDGRVADMSVRVAGVDGEVAEVGFRGTLTPLP